MKRMKANRLNKLSFAKPRMGLGFISFSFSSFLVPPFSFLNRLSRPCQTLLKGYFYKKREFEIFT